MKSQDCGYHCYSDPDFQPRFPPMPRNVLQTFGLLIATLAMPSIVHPEIYRWVDENGKVHFSDKPSRQHASEDVKLRINTYEGVTYDTATVDVGKKVVMYSAAWCGVCKKAKRYFQDNRIAYTEYDIETSAKGRSDFKKLGAKGVPVILVGNRRMNGFSAAGFEKLYQ